MHVKIEQYILQRRTKKFTEIVCAMEIQGKGKKLRATTHNKCNV